MLRRNHLRLIGRLITACAAVVLTCAEVVLRALSASTHSLPDEMRAIEPRVIQAESREELREVGRVLQNCRAFVPNPADRVAQERCSRRGVYQQPN